MGFFRRRKEKKQERLERISLKNFFDRTLPGVLKFYNDHYICGDSYRCVWAIKEYPPSTEEQAILSRLADRSNVTVRIYNRLVDAVELLPHWLWGDQGITPFPWRNPEEAGQRVGVEIS